MAVNYFTFGGVKSSDYGIYISGEGVFDAPKRAVEMVSVPGRNGALALDQGYYENITVTYPAFNHEGSMSDFRTKLANFRNAIASKIGYQRLTDTFHSDEYRMAMFVDGVEIKPIKYNTASEFEIKFQCKPQRYLTTGETVQTIANSGDALTNPTQYDSSPLLAVKGYGNIGFNGHQVSIQNVPIGDIELSGKRSGALSYSFGIDTTFLETGDTVDIDIQPILFSETIEDNTSSLIVFPSVGLVSDSNSDFSTSESFQSLDAWNKVVKFNVETKAKLSVTVGTDSTFTNTVSGSFHMGLNTINFTAVQTVQYNSSDDTISVSISVTVTPVSGYTVTDNERTVTIASVIGHSTKSALGNPTYIDCDTGECWMEVSGEITSLNRVISLGSILPTLKSGSNAITYDGTVTELKITPRWWKL